MMLHVLTIVTLFTPAAAALVLLVFAPSEGEVKVISLVSLCTSSLAAIALAIGVAASGASFDDSVWRVYSLGAYHLDVSIYVDPLACVMAALGGLVVPVIARFSSRYLHREPGYARFFTLLNVATTGYFWFVLAGSADMSLVGWELLGLSSALLVAFFWDRPETLVASSRLFSVYRVADVALLVGLVTLHHYAGDSEWHSVLRVTGVPATLLGLSFLLAAMGKSAQLPIGTYVLRAMEGPTPSSALFYGCLSIHAGVYLLLRVEPLLQASWVTRIAVIFVGTTSAIACNAASRVRADSKGALAMASAAQAGLMFVEIGMGWTTLATVHMAGHAMLRLRQILRSPSWLQDAQARRAAFGGGTYQPSFHFEQMLPARLQRFAHAAALSVFGVDAFVDRVVARPLAAIAHGASFLRQYGQHGTKIAGGQVPLSEGEETRS